LGFFISPVYDWLNPGKSFPRRGAKNGVRPRFRGGLRPRWRKKQNKTERGGEMDWELPKDHPFLAVKKIPDVIAFSKD